MFLRNQFKGDGVFELPIIKRQNKQSEEVARQLGLTKDQQQELHRLIGGGGMGFQEVLQFAREWFKK